MEQRIVRAARVVGVVALLQTADQLHVKRRDGRELFSLYRPAGALQYEQVGEQLQREAVVDALELQRVAAQLVVDHREGGLVLDHVDAVDAAVELDLLPARRVDAEGRELRTLQPE